MSEKDKGQMVDVQVTKAMSLDSVIQNLQDIRRERGDLPMFVTVTTDGGPEKDMVFSGVTAVACCLSEDSKEGWAYVPPYVALVGSKKEQMDMKEMGGEIVSTKRKDF